MIMRIGWFAENLSFKKIVFTWMVVYKKCTWEVKKVAVQIMDG